MVKIVKLGMVWSKFWSWIQDQWSGPNSEAELNGLVKILKPNSKRWINEWMNYQGRYRAARAAKYNFYRFGDISIPILVHETKKPFGSALLSHELLKGKTPILKLGNFCKRNVTFLQKNLFFVKEILNQKSQKESPDPCPCLRIFDPPHPWKSESWTKGGSFFAWWCHTFLVFCGTFWIILKFFYCV